MTLSPAFALRWLLPRLTRFQQRHPEIELRFVSSSDLHDFRSGDLDMAVRYGRGDWPGLEAERLMALDATAVCSPEVAATGPPLDAPADVAHRVRIHVENRPDDWRMWLLAAGVEGVDPAAGPVFESVPVALEAALNHIGLVIADRQVIARDLEDGRLVEPFGRPYAGDGGLFHRLPARQRRGLAHSGLPPLAARGDRGYVCRGRRRSGPRGG